MRPAGTTLQANDSLPMRESNSLFIHFLRCINDSTSSRIKDLRSSEMLDVMVLVSITIPKNVIWVLGGITFSAFDLMTKVQHGFQVLSTDRRLGRISCQEIVQVMKEKLNTVIMLKDLMNHCGKAVKYARGRT